MRKDTVELDLEDYNRLIEAYHAGRLATMMARPARAAQNKGNWILTEHYIERLTEAVRGAERVVTV